MPPGRKAVKSKSTRVQGAQASMGEKNMENDGWMGRFLRKNKPKCLERGQLFKAIKIILIK